MTANVQPAPASAYDLSPTGQVEQTATFALLVDNEPGVLHRVVGLFAARGYNIESLTVAETDRKAHTSRITVVTRGTRQVLDQIEAQLNKVVNVRRVHDVTRDPNGVLIDVIKPIPPTGDFAALYAEGEAPGVTSAGPGR